MFAIIILQSLKLHSHFTTAQLHFRCIDFYRNSTQSTALQYKIDFNSVAVLTAMQKLVQRQQFEHWGTHRNTDAVEYEQSFSLLIYVII